MLTASAFFIDTAHRPVATADDVIPPVLIDRRGEASRAKRERHTVRWPSLKRSWRRGNGFEPPSRAVHTRALPIQLPCRAKNYRTCLQVSSLWRTDEASWLTAASGDLVSVSSASALALYSWAITINRLDTSSSDAIRESRRQTLAWRRKYAVLGITGSPQCPATHKPCVRFPTNGLFRQVFRWTH